MPAGSLLLFVLSFCSQVEREKEANIFWTTPGVCSLNVSSHGAESLVEQISSNIKQQESSVEQICNTKPVGFGARRGTNFCLVPAVHQMLAAQ